MAKKKDAPTKSIPEIVMANKKKVHDLGPRFHEVFGRNLSDFFDTKTVAGWICGFDVIKFDEEVVFPADGVSSAEAIEARWGRDARKLIEELIR